MLPADLYTQAHLFVSAIRIYEHLHKQPPSLKGLSDTLGVSEEEISRVSRRLEEQGIISVVVSGAGARFAIRDHRLIEDLPRDVGAPRMEEEITQFKSRQETRFRGIEESLAKKGDKSVVFSELEKAMKDPSLLKKKNPLD
jgi:DNA-binding Lrp family transcriptional regulator